MTDPSSRSNLPQTRLDRGALERVLARAAELQGNPDEPTEEFTEEQLIELGKEVGLSPHHLRQAMAEERTKSLVPQEETGLLASLFGPSRVWAGRTVSGKPSDTLEAIDGWMQRQELLIVKRQRPERIVWEPRHDFLVGLKRAFNAGGRDYALSRAFEVSATVIPVDDIRVHVALDADFRSARRNGTAQLAGSTVFGAAATGAMLVMGVTAVVAAAPVVILPAIGIAAVRAYQERAVTRSQLALEQLLDRLERGELGRRPAESILGAIVAAATAIPPRRL